MPAKKRIRGRKPAWIGQILTRRVPWNLLLSIIAVQASSGSPTTTTNIFRQSPRLQDEKPNIEKRRNAVHQKRHNRLVPQRRLETLAIPADFFSSTKPQLVNTNSSSTLCSICRESELLENLVPFYESIEGLPPNLTCGDWEDIAATIDSDNTTCSDIRTFYPQCCQGSIPRYSCERIIRKTAFAADNYDAAVPPVISNREIFNITVDFRYQSVENIDVPQGTAKIFMTVHMEWKDPRLAWELDEDTCAEYVTVWAAYDRERTEIWVPDLDLYNQVYGFQNLPDTQAMVYHDGTVVWRRLGGVTAFCQFTGLAQIPFDVLGCQLLIGPWVRNDPTQIQYHLWNGTGLSFGDFRATFNEYLPVPELAESGVGPGGAIFYLNLFFKRSQHYYVFNLIVSRQQQRSVIIRFTFHAAK